MIDIEKSRELLPYLRSNHLIGKDEPVQMKQISGGVSCKVIRVETNLNTYVIKQALYKLRVKDDWFSDCSRIITERKCLSTYNRIIPDCVPKLIFHDDENYLFIMQAAPSRALPWKKKLLNGFIDPELGHKIALALAKVHNVSSRDGFIEKQFADQHFFYELRIEPYLETIKKKYPQIKSYIEQVIYWLQHEKTVLVHGDYSPKNILVAGQQIYILDFEVAHWGNPAFDLAFLTNHLMLKAVKSPKWAAGYFALMNRIINIYFDFRDNINREKIEAETVMLLALLFLARVDGKSPAEYITREADKNLIRKLSFQILENQYRNYEQLIQFMHRNRLNKERKRNE